MPAELLMADWIFGYGSLIWNPEVDFNHSALGRVHGYHRSFCIHSTLYRGTPDEPGVVLGLMRGGSCVGVAFRLAEASRRDSIERLYAREMLNSVYVPTLASVKLSDGRQVRALTFVANPASTSFRRLTEGEILSRLTRARGQRGPNRDYAINTHQSLRERGVQDNRLSRLVARLGDAPR
jgi:cation transport protein ChaC